MEELREELHRLIEEHGVSEYDKLIECDMKLHNEIIKSMGGQYET